MIYLVLTIDSNILGAYDNFPAARRRAGREFDQGVPYNYIKIVKHSVESTLTNEQFEVCYEYSNESGWEKTSDQKK